MKIFGRVIMVLMIAGSFGCQTTQGQSGGATSTSTYEAPATTSAPATKSTPAPAKASTPAPVTSSSSSSSGVKMLTDADYKRMGLRETYDLRQ